MRAITIRQPWASLIAIGAKQFETRAYQPPRKLLGRRIAIHAAAREIRLKDFSTDVKVAIRNALPCGSFDLPLGAVVCTAILDSAHQCGEPTTAYGGRACWSVRQEMPGSRSINSNIIVDLFGDYSPGRWAWRLSDVVILDEPAPAKGKQGWWEWAP